MQSSHRQQDNINLTVSPPYPDGISHLTLSNNALRVLTTWNKDLTKICDDRKYFRVDHLALTKDTKIVPDIEPSNDSNEMD